MGDKENLQSGSVSPDSGTESTETETQAPDSGTEEQQQAQPFTQDQEARMQQLLTEASARAEEKGRREMQGIKDKEVAEADKRARLAEGDSAAYKTSFGELDDDVRDKAELARLRGREAQQTQQGQWDDFKTNLIQSLQDEVTALGIDPNDDRIDYATSEADYFAGRRRFTTSISKIVKGNQKVAEDKQKQDFETFKREARKDLGLDSVTTDISAGTSDGIPTDIEKFKVFVADLSQSEYEKLKPKIDEMQAKGKIK